MGVQVLRKTEGSISDIRHAESVTFQSSLQDSPRGSMFYPALEVPDYFRVVPLGRNAAVCVLTQPHVFRAREDTVVRLIFPLIAQMAQRFVQSAIFIWRVGNRWFGGIFRGCCSRGCGGIFRR